MSQDTRNEEGRIIGGQFLVQGDEELVFGLRTVECIDQNSEMSVRLTFVSRSALEQLGVAIRIQKDVKRAGALLHKNITRVLGFGKDGDQLFIVEEQTSGFRLSHLLNRRSETERPFELKQAFYLTIHLCNALSNATDKLAHGLLAPSNVFIRKDGRPKVSGFGTGALLPIVVEGEGVTDWDRACLAPHLDSPGKRDLFALGRLFYALLKNSVDTRTSFAEQVESDDELSPSLMRLLLRCAGEGDVKPLSGPSEFREELHHVVSELFENETTKRRREPSVGPPPMPSELDLDLAAKPPGVDLR
ncbi:MAG: protein kinase, partial [Bradymonadia bacterium]